MGAIRQILSELGTSDPTGIGYNWNTVNNQRLVLR